MEEVRQTNVDDVTAGLRDRLVQFREPSGNVMFLRERLRAIRISRKDGDHFGLGHEPVIGLDMNLRDETGAEQGDFRFGHRNGAI